MRRKKAFRRVLAGLLVAAMLTSDLPVFATEVNESSEEIIVDSDSASVETESIASEEDSAANAQESEQGSADESQEATGTSQENTQESAGEASSAASASGQESTETSATAQEYTEESATVQESAEASETQASTETTASSQEATNTEASVTAAQSSENAAEDYSDLMSLEELTALSEEEVGATMWLTSAAMGSGSGIMLTGLEEGGLMTTAATVDKNWTFDVYYVNEDDSHYVEETSDFTLKYQMEFHTSDNLAAGDVVIRIPAALLTYRDGTTDILPTDIAVPYGTDLSNYTSSRTTPFNYYYETVNGVEYLVFWNYRTITAGSNAAWQVLYKNLEVMQIVDMTEWSLQADITVTIHETEKDVNGNPLTDADGNIVFTGTVLATQTDSPEPLGGLVDTSITLTSVRKSTYTETGKSYTPGLYTVNQLETYTSGTIDQKYIDNFDNYYFVVWDVRISGRATQAWNLEILDTTTLADGSSGEVVGYTLNQTGGYMYILDMNLDQSALSADGAAGGYQLVKECSTDESFSARLYVVTAYPKSSVNEGDILTNNISVRMIPYDGIDEVQEKSASATYAWANYNWVYDPGDIIGIEKTYDESYSGWLELYRYAQTSGEEEAYASFPFITTGTFYGYGATHHISGGHLGEYIEGLSYTLTTVDDFLYLFPDAKIGSGADEISEKGVMMTSEDYYFSSVTVTQTDVGYDVWEDTTTDPEIIDQDKIDQNLYIYAMFADADTSKTDTEGWELVAVVDWDDSGVMTYEFSEADIARGPYRVKAVHTSVNYNTTCDIEAEVCIRYASPLMKKVMEAYENGEVSEIRFENISGIAGAYYEYNENTKENDFVTYIHFQTVGNDTYDYGEPGLLEETLKLYPSEDSADLTATITLSGGSTVDKNGGILLQRDNAYKTVTGLKERAASYKTSTSENDSTNSRVNLTYNLTAYDGYQVYDAAAVSYLQAAGVESPGRNAVVFYDLLPYGVQFDPSAEVTVGRITSLTNNYYQTRPSTWDTSQVSVTVETEANYNNTGRTMVIFHITYSGADSAVFSQGLWMEGWGVSFGAYYEWKDMDLLREEANICAFLPEDYVETTDGAGNITKTLSRLHGASDEVYPDDGSSYPAGQEDIYKYFGSDFNQDGNTTTRYVLYATETTEDDYPVASSSKIEKLVKADSDTYGTFSTSAVVEVGGYYTYEITVSNASEETVKDIVVYDHLEQAQVDRASDNDIYSGFANYGWYGTFVSVVTTGLDELGIDYKIYYNASSDAALSSGSGLTGASSYTKPSDVLTAENGWYEASVFLTSYDASEVKSIAIDLSKKTDGTDFTLGNMESVSFQIRMKAPDSAEYEKLASDVIYTYNNPAYYCTEVENNDPDSATSSTVSGNSVRVEMSENDQLEIVKELGDNTPDSVLEENPEFEFRLTETKTYADSGGSKYTEETAFAYQEYQLWRKQTDEDGNYVLDADSNVMWEQVTDQIYATDANGYLYLHADEKAVFVDLPNADRVHVSESENPFWDVKTAESSTTITVNGKDVSVRTVSVTNTYRPVLYAQKKLLAVPDDDTTGLADTTFTFRLLIKEIDENTGNESWVPVKNAEFWYVDSVRTDGGIPSKDTTQGKNGIGTTDEYGCFSITAGQIIALFPGSEGTVYELREVIVSTDGSGNTVIQEASQDNSDWIVLTSGESGELEVSGSSASITNIYKWKDLLLTKTLTNQDAADCTQQFTFQITHVLTDEDGNETGEIEVVKGKRWVLLDDDGNESTAADESGTLDDNGEFTVACAGRTVKIEGLEAGETYIITETDSGENYEPVVDSIETTMPVYSSSRSVEYENEYLLRPISVSKIVTYDREAANAAATAADIKLTYFTMTIYVDQNGDGVASDDEPLANWPYTVTANGSVVEETTKGEHTTSAEGVFKIKDGQTFTFEDVGKTGTVYRIVESQNTIYGQIYPVLDAADVNGETGAQEGELEDDGTSVTFINGTPGGLVISKEYTAAANDTTAEEYIALMQITDQSDSNYATGTALREDAAVKLSLQVTTSSGTCQWPTQDVQVTTVDQLTNEVKTVTWKTGSTFEVQPWVSVVISSLTGGLTTGETVISYTLTEDSDSQHRVFEYSDGTWIEISQYDPADDGAAGGTLSENPVATITNLATSYQEQSEVEKRMTIGSDEPSVGETLVWKLEEYDQTTGIWNPSAGIKYLTADDAGLTCDTVLTTGSDGLITLTKTANGYPKVKFLENYVYLNLYDTADISTILANKTNSTPLLRLVEETDQSDPGWGSLAGYGTADSQYAYSLGTDAVSTDGLTPYATAFVNSNRSAALEIEKYMETPSDATFTMILQQVLSTTEGKSFSDYTESDILESVAAANIPYSIYDSETNELIGTGVTDTDGGVSLKAGQYARFDDLPDGTMWTVSEQTRPDHELKDLTGTPSSRTTKLGDNLMLIHAKSTETAAVLEVNVLGFVGTSEALDKESLFEVTVYRSDGTYQKLDANEYAIDQTTSSSTAGSMPVTITYDAENLSTIANVTVVANTELTRSMVENGVIDALTGQTVVLNTGDVTIPKYIRDENGVVWRINGIENGSWSGGSSSNATGVFARTNITSVTLPDSMTYIGMMAFVECAKLKTIVLNNGLQQISSGAFWGCTGLETITIPETVTEISWRAFQNCTSLQNVEIPDNVTTISSYMFYECTALTSVTLPSKLTSVPEYMFYGCSGLESVTLPDSVKTIGKYAFYGSGSGTGVLSIGSGITSIGDQAFYKAKYTSITINKTENSISGSPWGYTGTITWTGTE